MTPDKTQILKGRIKKDIVQLQLARELPSYWDALVSEEEPKGRNGLSAMFRMAQKTANAKYQEILVVLPDVLFSLISSYPTTSEKRLDAHVAEILNVDSLDEFYVCKPIETKPPFRAQTTVYALQKLYVDRLIRAAQEAKATLISVEPASMAFIRCYRQWQVDYPIIEMFNTESTMITFSPVGGVIRNDTPHMGVKELLSNRSHADKTITKAISVNRFSTGESFGSMRPDSKYIVLSENADIHKIPAIRHNEHTELVAFPDFIDSDIPRKKQLHWMCAAGTFLQMLENDLELYSGKHAATSISNANLLPEELQSKARNKQRLKIITNSLKIIAVFMGLILGGESAATIYYGSMEVPASLSADYQKAKKDKPLLEAELKCLTDARKQDLQVMDAYTRLMKARPKECYFTDVAIGSRDPNKTGGNKYAVINLISKDEMLFNDMISALQEDRFFASPSLTTVRSDQKGSSKTGTLNIAKGGG